jgi:hypothetical protein
MKAPVTFWGNLPSVASCATNFGAEDEFFPNGMIWPAASSVFRCGNWVTLAGYLLR